MSPALVGGFFTTNATWEVPHFSPSQGKYDSFLTAFLSHSMLSNKQLMNLKAIN